MFVPKARRETALESARLEKEEKEKEQKRNIEKVSCLTKLGIYGLTRVDSKPREVFLVVVVFFFGRPCNVILEPLSCLDAQENRKRETRQLAAQVVRREEEMTENHLGDNESEGDAPDDDDDLDEV